MIRHSGPLPALLTAVLAAMVALGPIPFGAVQPPARAALQVAAFVALALALAAPGRRLGDLAPVRWPLAALVGVGLWGLVQSLPWPDAVVALLSPRLARAWSDARALLASHGGGELAAALSVAPEVSRRAALHWLALAAALAAACLHGTERAGRRLVFFALLAGAVGQILYGAGAWRSGAQEILGVEVPGAPGRLRGTFVNPDHFAFLVAIALACTGAWLWWSLRRAVSEKTALDRRLSLPASPLLAFVVLFAGLAFSGSRAGIAVAVVMVLIQGMALALHYRRWQLGLATVAVVFVGFAGLAVFGWRQGLGRWFETSAYEVTVNARLEVWAATVELWLASPVSGVGLGTFRQAFPMVQPTGLTRSWHHAHSDVLELLATAGLVVVPLMAMAAVGLARRLWRVFGRGRRSEDRAAALGALGAAVACGLHSLVDFGLAMPANAFTLAVVCGLACGCGLLPSRRAAARRAQPSPSSRTSPGTTAPPATDSTHSRWGRGSSGTSSRST